MNDSLQTYSQKSEKDENWKESIKLCRMSKFVEKKFEKSCSIDESHDIKDRTSDLVR